MRRSRPIQIGAVALVLLTASCAPPDTAGGPAVGDASGQPGEYLCHGTPVPAAVLADGTTADQLGDESAAALDGASVPEIEPEQWRVLAETSTRVYLIRELPEPRDTDDGERRTHELLGIEQVDQTEDGGAGWQLAEYGDCALRHDLGELGDAIVALDPDNPPDPASEEVHLLVTEVTCASGKPADGRIELERLVELEDRVELVIGVEPLPGDQTCPSNPPTPFTIELDEPLGDRTLLDAVVHPEQELTVTAEMP